jgi:heptaprenyl diphosphate synthase
MKNTREFVLLSLLTSMALVLSVLESMIPFPFVAPGAKLGLPNMVTLAVLVVFGFRRGMTIAILRTILFMLVAGNPVGFMYAVSGAFTSTIVMYFVYKYFSQYFSLVGVSLFGAFAHNTAQACVAALMLQNVRILYYLPIMYIVGIFTGCFVGYASIFIIKNLELKTNLVKWS